MKLIVQRVKTASVRVDEKGLKLYEEYGKQHRELGPHVEIGIFQAEMGVSLINDGPVTLILESTGRME